VPDVPGRGRGPARLPRGLPPAGAGRDGRPHRRARRGPAPSPGARPDALDADRGRGRRRLRPARRGLRATRPRHPVPRAAPPVPGRRLEVVLRPRPRGLHPLRSLHRGLRRGPADRRDQPRRQGPRGAGRRVRRPADGELGLHLVRPVRRDLPDRRLAPQGDAGADRAAGRDHLPLLRGRLRHREHRARGRPPRGDGGRRPGEPLERGHAVRQGALRDRLRPRAGPRAAPDGPARGTLGAGRLGRGARPRRRGARPPPGRLRRARLGQGDQRGRLPHPEALPRRDGYQQRRPLHPPLPLAVGRGDAGLDGLRRHLELVRRLRGGGVPLRRGGGREREPPGDRDPLPPRRRPRGPPGGGQSEAGRAVRPGRPLDPRAAGERRRPLQRHGARDPRRGPVGPGVRREPDRGLRGVARGGPPLHPRAGRASDRRAGRGHRPGGALVRAAPVRRVVPRLGHGRDAARERHRERARAPQPLAPHRPAGPAGKRHLAPPRTEQRPGMRGRGLHPHQPARLPALRPRDARPVRARVGRRSARAWW
jgi:hypothetical protein